MVMNRRDIMKKIEHSNSERDNEIKRGAGRSLAIAAIATGALSLFLSSTNNGIPIASAQFTIPDEDSAASPSPSPPETTTGGTGDNFLLRGFVGSMIIAEDEDDNQTELGNYALAGRWRLVVNESEARRFVANFSMGTTNGSDLHNVFIENLPGTSESGVESNTTDGGARSYSMRADLQIDNTETIRAVPITVTMNGDVLSVNVDSNEEISSDGNDTFRTLRGETIYGIVDR
jgi:hypothetical protein